MSACLHAALTVPTLWRGSRVVAAAFLLLLFPPLAHASSNLRVAPGSVVSTAREALCPPWHPMNELDVELDGHTERVVLYGRADEDGVERVEGLIILKPNTNGLVVSGSAANPWIRGASVTLRVDVDVDGDGVRELVVTERLKEAGIERAVETWWSWRPRRHDLALIHVSELLYRDDGFGIRPPREERRTVTTTPRSDEKPATLIERVVRSKEGSAAPEFWELRYRLDPTTGHFVPAPTPR